MGAALRNDYSLDEMEVKYNAVTEIFDLADELLVTVESPFVKNAEAQMDLVEPLINELGDATDILAEEFILLTESTKGGAKKPNKARIENALRKMFNALHDYQERVKTQTVQLQGTMKNIADPIVAKIQRHIEEVVVIFLEFINLSLASIMQKQQLEAVRARDPRIALMMHQHALAQQ